MNCLESVSDQERVRNKGAQLQGIFNDQAVWDAYVQEMLEAKAKCDKLWKEKEDRERQKSWIVDKERQSWLLEPPAAAAMAGENSGKERWRTRLQTGLCRVFQGSCLSVH